MLPHQGWKVKLPPEEMKHTHRHVQAHARTEDGGCTREHRSEGVIPQIGVVERKPAEHVLSNEGMDERRISVAAQHTEWRDQFGGSEMRSDATHLPYGMEPVSVVHSLDGSVVRSST